MCDGHPRRRARPRTVDLQPLDQLRSVVVLGRAVEVQERAEKLRALEAFSDRIVPGRWAEVRGPNAKELKATAILRLPLVEASAKIRRGPPRDYEEDLAVPVWAGVIPVSLAVGKPVPDPRLASDADAPAWAPTTRRS